MKPILVCLHGWGGSKESFTELREALKDTEIEIFSPDLPGFGSEPEPPRPWTVDDYADWVEHWIREHIPADRLHDGIFLLGHSHGGRIAIKMAVRMAKTSASDVSTVMIHHLFLCAPAGIRHARHFKRIIGLTLAKAGKALLSIPGARSLQPLGKKLLYKLVRVHDYEKASPMMRETMIRISAEDLRPLLSHIDTPTDLFWGTDDRMTPIGDARIMEQDIRGSRLHVYPGVRHRVHRDRAGEIARVIEQVLSQKNPKF